MSWQVQPVVGQTLAPLVMTVTLSSVAVETVALLREVTARPTSVVVLSAVMLRAEPGIIVQLTPSLERKA